MLIVAQHTVLDPDAFWKAAAGAPIPDYLKLHQVLPSQDGLRGVCLWEADSVEAVANFVDTYLGDISRNEYFAVQMHNAVLMSLAGTLTDGGDALDSWATGDAASDGPGAVAPTPA